MYTGTFGLLVVQRSQLLSGKHAHLAVLMSQGAERARVGLRYLEDIVLPLFRAHSVADINHSSLYIYIYYTTITSKVLVPKAMMDFHHQHFRFLHAF